MSEWGEQVNPDSVLPEYPRPQLQRKHWLNLNGLWQFEITTPTATLPFDRALTDTILVPFPVESALSGIMQPVTYAWYKHWFNVPAEWADQRILLHFGAVDWHSKIYLNGQFVLEHKGGYDPFTVDITDQVLYNAPNQLIVWVYDPTDNGGQPVGKQSENPESIWFTAVSGIWQTVWLEPVPQTYIKSLKMIPDIDKGQLELTVSLNDSTTSTQITAAVWQDSILIAQATGYANAPLILQIPDAHLWSPEDPFLYDLQIKTHDFSGANDTVHSYFAMRKIGLKQDDQGRVRLALNNKIYFQFGPLDQGYWPGGLYTAPSDEALRFDIQEAKRLGFNMIRKHVKVEPQRWYYWCDKLGMLVWQDMPNAKNVTADDKTQFENELTAMIEHLFNHPCIVVWVIFNENWGKFNVQQLASDVRNLDATRLINVNSGWNINGFNEALGDINDIHHYEEPQAPAPDPNRAIVCGEFGGLWRQVEGHTWTAFEGAGYQSGNAFANRYVELTHMVQDLINNNGLSAAVYTEITDIEREYAGLVTYDRKVEKAYYLPIYYANQNTIVTALETNYKHNPQKFKLFQNYPNPFNDQTTISFWLPVSARLDIEIFNLKGQKIKSFTSKFLKAGLNKIRINARNWASGVYFYRIKGSNFSSVKKMILIR